MIALAVFAATACAGVRAQTVASPGGETSFAFAQMPNCRTELRQTTERNCAKLPIVMDAFDDNVIYYSLK